MKKNSLKYSILPFAAGIVLSIIALYLLSIFNIKNAVFNNRTVYILSDSTISHYYIPGYILLILSLSMNVIGVIFMALRLFPKKKVEENNRERPFLLSSLVVYFFTVGLFLLVIINLISSQFSFYSFRTGSISIQYYDFFGFYLAFLPTACSIVGIILSVIGLTLKNKPNENQIQLITRKFNLKGDTLKSPFILILTAIILSFVSSINFIIFNIVSIKTSYIYNDSIIEFDFLPATFIFIISLIIFIIGFIKLTKRIEDQIQKDEKNIMRKKLLIPSAIIIFLGFLILPIAFLRILVMFDLQSFTYGFIFFIIATILTVTGTVILGLAISSRNDLNNNFSKNREQIFVKKRNNIKSSIILTSIATVIYIGVFIMFIALNGYISTSPRTYETICASPPLTICWLGGKIGIYVPFSDLVFYYLPGIFLYTISLILYIIGIIKFIIGNKKIENNVEKSRKNDINIKILRLFFVVISIGITISLIAYSRFIILTWESFTQYHVFLYFITNSQIQNYFDPGFNLFVISLGVYMLGIILLVINKLLIGKERN